MKTCSKCGVTKERSDFFRSGRHKSGKEKIRGDCKSCAAAGTEAWREKNRSKYNNYVAMWRSKNPEKQHRTEIKRNYGLAIEDYNRMLSEQNCRCKICGAQHDPTRKRGRLYVDHCHASKKVRGLLCQKCNTAIGALDDRVDLLQRAILYLQNVQLSA